MTAKIQKITYQGKKLKWLIFLNFLVGTFFFINCLKIISEFQKQNSYYRLACSLMPDNLFIDI